MTPRADGQARGSRSHVSPPRRSRLPSIFDDRRPDGRPLPVRERCRYIAERRCAPDLLELRGDRGGSLPLPVRRTAGVGVRSDSNAASEQSELEDPRLQGSSGDRLVRLPFFNELSEPEQMEVVDTVRRFRCQDSAQRQVIA